MYREGDFYDSYTRQIAAPWWLFLLLGLNLVLLAIFAFPIMAAGAGIAGAAAGSRCCRTVELDWRIVLGLTIGAIPAVLVAAFIVKEMPVTMLRWLVAVVVTYAGVTLLLTATRGAELVPPDAPQAAVEH